MRTETAINSGAQLSSYWVLSMTFNTLPNGRSRHSTRPFKCTWNSWSNSCDLLNELPLMRARVCVSVSASARVCKVGVRLRVRVRARASGGKVVFSSRVKSAKAKLNKICLAAIQSVNVCVGVSVCACHCGWTGQAPSLADAKPTRLNASHFNEPTAGVERRRRAPPCGGVAYVCLPTKLRQVQQQQQWQKHQLQQPVARHTKFLSRRHALNFGLKHLPHCHLKPRPHCCCCCCCFTYCCCCCCC